MAAVPPLEGPQSGQTSFEQTGELIELTLLTSRANWPRRNRSRWKISRLAPWSRQKRDLHVSVHFSEMYIKIINTPRETNIIYLFRIELLQNSTAIWSFVS